LNNVKHNGIHLRSKKSLLHGNFFSSYGPDDGHKNDRNMYSKETYIKTSYNQV